MRLEEKILSHCVYAYLSFSHTNQVVNVYRLITRNTLEEKILGLQKFKLKTANSVITKDNSSLSSMATGDQIFDLFSLEEVNEVNEDDNSDGGAKSSGGGGVGMKAFLENLPEVVSVGKSTTTLMGHFRGDFFNTS